MAHDHFMNVTNKKLETKCIAMQAMLTLSSPVVPNGLSARVPERQKNKNGVLDQYGFEHFVV